MGPGRPDETSIGRPLHETFGTTDECRGSVPEEPVTKGGDARDKGIIASGTHVKERLLNDQMEG